MPEALCFLCFCLLSICKRTPLLDTEGFYLLAWLRHTSNGIHGLVRFADRSCRFGCLLAYIHTHIHNNEVYIFVFAQL